MKYLKYFENLNELTQDDVDILFIDIKDKSFEISLSGKSPKFIAIRRLRNHRSDPFKFQDIEECLKTAIHYLTELYHLTDIKYEVYGQVSEPQPEFTMDYRGFESDEEKGLNPFETEWVNCNPGDSQYERFNRQDVWIDEIDIILK